MHFLFAIGFYLLYNTKATALMCKVAGTLRRVVMVSEKSGNLHRAEVYHGHRQKGGFPWQETV